MLLNFADKIKHIDNNPAQYSEFLKSGYKDVNLTVTDIVGPEPSYQVQVSALNPSGNGEVFTFTVEELNGRWFITNEE